MIVEEKNQLDQPNIFIEEIQGEVFFKISNTDQMRPFFMSIVSDSDHWMFIGSNGGLTAGRRNSDYSLFPYYTDDKVVSSYDNTGSKTIIKVVNEKGKQLWEPFSERYFEVYKTTRNLYKNLLGNKVIFEEINNDLKLKFSYEWNNSNQFGFVRKSKIENLSEQSQKLEILDGIQNIVPYGVGSDLQNLSSNLVDAYKRSEIVEECGLGIYALSAIIVDKAEPSEALKANLVWSQGMDNPVYLASSVQLDQFRAGGNVNAEDDIKAEKGAYFLVNNYLLSPNQEKEWWIIADVNKDHVDVENAIHFLNKTSNIKEIIQDDIDRGSEKLSQFVSAADGFQFTSDARTDARHYSNTLFNIMRGGIFDNGYLIEKWDFSNYLRNANKKINASHFLSNLDDTFSVDQLKKQAESNGDPDLIRLCYEYLPLKFSRRHGDPSRPWNRFSINLRNEVDGSKILDYEGNWRDIFQNWEALAFSYPDFLEGMIFKFLNATTFDGYNPYRVTKDGFDWETIEPDNPWSYIGYWGDHQIIYLLKFLELQESLHPGYISANLKKDVFVYANVPYKIKSYEEIVKNPKDTIVFDHQLDLNIRASRENEGADAALLKNRVGEIYHVNLFEKILVTLLTKLSNFIPEGGIWMNTQRPEWNDANNALVGNGVSMVTLYYLRRFIKFLDAVLDKAGTSHVDISHEVKHFQEKIASCFHNNLDKTQGPVSDLDRRQIMDELGKAGSEYRDLVYNNSFNGSKEKVNTLELKSFFQESLEFLDKSIDANKRKDHLYHAYNILSLPNRQQAQISYLSEMLEGQVAVLSSGYLNIEEIIQLLNALKDSKLYRPDQHSYLLYPNKELPKFREKNTINEDLVMKSKLLKRLISEGNEDIIRKDVNGHFHFNGRFKNASDLEKALSQLDSSQYEHLTGEEKNLILGIFEKVFNHKAFTGRSGTFYGYEGLGSIYWHMVSKLRLAVMECCIQGRERGVPEALLSEIIHHYYEISKGLGVHKSPKLYGAFPTDPYSHTPANKGAQQPGMTGQVKEDIISRFGELGIVLNNNTISFDPFMLRKEEFLKETKVVSYFDISNESKSLTLEQGMLFFTLCQVPFIYKISDEKGIRIEYQNGEVKELTGLSLSENISKDIFDRKGEVSSIMVHIPEDYLF